METKKYILTEEKTEHLGITLYRIKAIRVFGNIKEGELGGWIESEDNLSQEGNAWVYDNAWVYGNAKVFGYAWVYDDAKVFSNAQVCGDAQVCGNAEVSNKSDYIVFKNWWSSEMPFTWTRSNNMWRVGCFYGTGDELIKRAYADSKKSGREYERVVRYVESILADENEE